MNWGFVPGAADEFAGVTVITCNGFATVSVAVPVTPEEVAEMVTPPGATPVASPPEEMVAMVLLEDCQVAVAVRSWVVLSAKVPMAVNCWVFPGATGLMVIAAGVTAMETSELATVSVVEPVIPPNDAEMVVGPPATAVAKPPVLMVATDAVEDSQLAVLVRFLVLPSLKDPVAVNCCVAPGAIVGFAGVT